MTRATKQERVAICELASTAYSLAETLIREGYSFDLDNPPEHYVWSGQASIHLILKPTA